MNACSYSALTFSCNPIVSGSWSIRSAVPARLSSQFGPHWIASISRPVICERARATGSCSDSGAVISFS